MASAIPPLAVPSSLVSAIPVTSTASRNSSAWRRPFWPVVASIVSSVSCGAPGACALDHLAHLAQLVHQVLLGVQPPGGVADHHVVPARARGLDRVEHHGAGVGARLAAHDLAAGPLGPQGQLLGRRGAEGVARGQQHRAAELLLQVPGDLADRGGLAAAVDPHHEDHRGLLGEGDRVAVHARGLGQQLAQAPCEVLAALQLAGLRLVLEPLDDRGRGGRAHVGVDQRLLEVLEGLVVERLEHRGLELGAERLARLRHVLAQAAEEAAALGLVLRGRRRAAASSPVTNSSCQVRAMGPRG